MVEHRFVERVFILEVVIKQRLVDTRRPRDRIRPSAGNAPCSANSATAALQNRGPAFLGTRFWEPRVPNPPAIEGTSSTSSPSWKRIGRAAEEANVFLVHINIQEAPRLSRFIPQMRFRSGNCESSSAEQLA
jgi:hypothetical protein